MFETIHFLHLASGTIWAGGAFAFAFVVEPAMARLDRDGARAYMAEQAPFAARLMAVSGLLLLLTGGARTLAGGGAIGPADLLSPYGLMVMLSFAIVMGVTIYGNRHRAALSRALEAAGDHRPVIVSLQRRHALVTGSGILVTIGIMAILGLGLS